MKGKYAAKADRRREFTGLEERAVAAERECDRLTAELSALRERSEERITGLRSEASSLRKQREAAASPRLTELEQENNRLRKERDAAFVLVNQVDDVGVKFALCVADLLCDRLGMTRVEAFEVVDALRHSPTRGDRYVDTTGVTGGDSGAVKALQRARGLRGPDDPAAEIAPGARIIVSKPRKAQRVRPGSFSPEEIERLSAETGHTQSGGASNDT